MNPPQKDQDWDWAIARQHCLRHARRFLRSPDDAEEAVQEALLRAWRKRGQCRDAHDPLGWMLGITRNEAIRVAMRRRETVSLDAVPEAVAESVSDEILLGVHVRGELDRLAPEDRMLLELRYAEDLTQSAVADRAGVPEGTVKVRLHRLRRHLRSALGESS